MTLFFRKKEQPIESDYDRWLRIAQIVVSHRTGLQCRDSDGNICAITYSDKAAGVAAMAAGYRSLYSDQVDALEKTLKAYETRVPIGTNLRTS